jgi:hypothetical protein
MWAARKTWRSRAVDDSSADASLGGEQRAALVMGSQRTAENSFVSEKRLFPPSTKSD